MIVISVLSQDMKKPESAPANPRKAMILIYRDTLESYYLNLIYNKVVYYKLQKRKD